MTRALSPALFALFALFGLWALPACNVASVQEQPSVIPQNQCTSDADCGVGSCIDETCRSPKGTFDTILFEVTPPADATAMVGSDMCSDCVQFIKPVTDVLASDGNLDLELDSVTKISAKVLTARNGCTPQFVDDSGSTPALATDHSIPALVTVTPSSGALGLFSSSVAVMASLTLANMSSFTCTLTVPQGDYDIYIQPQHQPTADCPIPPQLLRAYPIGTENLNFELRVPQKFELHVDWPPGDGGLDGWVVDMLDPISGRVISNRTALALGSKPTDYVANLAYLPVIGDAMPVDQFVRLSPPPPPSGMPALTAPTLLFARSGLGLFSASSGRVSQFVALPTKVHIAGAVTARVTPEPVAATVTLVATKLTGIDPGIVASFVRTVSVQQDGTFELDVLPGTYRVSAVPSGTSAAQGTLAEANVEWDVGTSPIVQAGKVIELSDTLPISGVARDPSGVKSMTGAQVQAVASPASIVTDVLHQALGEVAYAPRAASTTIDSSGNFTLKVDTGTYDFSVRPRASSGYAWLAIPSVPVGTTPATSNGPGLDVLNLPLPVVYQGNLTVPVPGATADIRTPVAGALISAYIYMKGGAYTPDANEADSVLQIAEARCDDTGAFVLRIPAALNAPPQ